MSKARIRVPLITALVVALAVSLSFPSSASPGARAWAPRVEVRALCYQSTESYTLDWTVVNTHPNRPMRILSTTRPLSEEISGATEGTAEQRVRVRWRWRSPNGTLHIKRGVATYELDLDGTCTTPVIQVEATTTAIHSYIDVYWGTIGTDSSATHTLTPFVRTVQVDPDYDIVSITAFEDDGINTTLECAILVDGSAVEQATGTGPYSSCDVARVFELSEPIVVDP